MNDMMPERSALTVGWGKAILWGLGATFVALGVQFAVSRITGVVAPLATFYPAVTIAGLVSGRRAGWIALVSGAIAAWFFLMHPVGAFAAPSTADGVRLGFFAVCGSILVIVSGGYRALLERTRASEASATRSARLVEAIGAASPHLIYAKDRAFRTIYANPAALKALGVPEGGVIGHTAAEYATHSIEGEAHADNDRQVIDSGEIGVWDERFTSPDGTTRIYRSTKAPLRDPEGAIIGIAGVSVDITDEQATEAALRASEARLRLAMEAGRMAVWDYDNRTEHLVSSPELNHLFGYPADLVLTVEHVRRGYQPGQRERLLEAARSALERGERFFEAEFPFTRPDGDMRWFLMRAEMIIGPDGSPERVTGVVLDITVRKQAEAALAEREAELKAALDAGSLAVVDYDHRTGALRASPRLAELYGYPPGHDITIEDIRARYHPDDAGDVEAKVRRDDRNVEGRSFDWTIHLLLPGGSERWLQGIGEYLRGEDGHIVRSRGVVMDVTERKRWEEHQRLLVNELNHRVKNTLAVVQALAWQSFAHEPAAAAARGAFEARLAALSAAHDLLTSRNWEAADLSAIVAQAATLTDAARFNADGPAVQLSPKSAISIAMALHELGTNAIKYGALSNDGGIVHLNWSMRQEDGRERLHLEWREEGGPAVAAPERKGFGSRMIERGLAAELGGEVRLHFEPSGVRCVIDAPIER